jgi:tripartite ATP-independent transporter DctM subunit
MMLDFYIATAILIITIIIGVPIAFAIALTTIIYILTTAPQNITIIPLRMYSGVDSFVLMALPLFMIAAEIMMRTGISEKLFNFVRLCVGRVRGGLAYVNIGASTVFGSIAGAALSDIAAMGNIEITEMTKQGYTKEFACGVTAGSSLQSPLIPPSNIVILYAGIMGLSVGALLIAGLVPGLVLALIECGWIFLNRKTRNLPKDTTQYTWAQKINICVNGSVALIMPFIILGGITFGFFTPVEAAGIAVLYALLVGFIIWRNLKLSEVIAALKAAALSAAQLFIIISFSTVFAWALGAQNVPEQIAQALLKFSDNPLLIMLIINIILIIVGMWMETNAAILLFAPILAPIAYSVGIHPIHFAIIMLLNLVVGSITPPVGVILYATSAVSKVPFAEVTKATMPFMIIGFGAITIVTLFPEVVLFVPRLLGFL